MGIGVSIIPFCLINHSSPVTKASFDCVTINWHLIEKLSKRRKNNRSITARMNRDLEKGHYTSNDRIDVNRDCFRMFYWFLNWGNKIPYSQSDCFDPFLIWSSSNWRWREDKTLYRPRSLVTVSLLLGQCRAAAAWIELRPRDIPN